MAAESELCLFCYEGDGTVPLGQILRGHEELPTTVSIVIGSEGGFSVKEVERARTYPELEPRVGTVLYLDYAQNGVGSAACGPTLPAEHRFSEKEFTFAFQIRFEESGGTT